MKDNDKRKVYEWIEENYSNLTPVFVTEEYDTLIIYLHNPDHNWLCDCKILYYNSNYPSEFNMYDLKPVDK